MHTVSKKRIGHNTMLIDAQTLKTRYRERRDGQSQALATRIHRSISWLTKAESEQDVDSKFILLWISFNAAYAQDFSQELETRSQFKDFLDKLLSLDKNKYIHALLFNEFNGLIRTLISNKYIYAPFWQAVRTHDNSDAWQKSHSSSIKLATTALLKTDTITILSIIFDRLYVLRNQLIHGGATWQSSVNRQQVSDGSKMLGKLIPQLLALMIESDNVDFGEIMYPVV
jgi:hypothetical protein